MRRVQTDAENRLWYHLRAGRLLGWKFRRQHPMPPYVLDFYCHQARLAIEPDGSQHSKEADATRTQSIEAQDIRVLRFWDNAVLSDTEAVLEVLLSVLEDRTLSPWPSPGGRGE